MCVLSVNRCLWRIITISSLVPYLSPISVNISNNKKRKLATLLKVRKPLGTRAVCTKWSATAVWRDDNKQSTTNRAERKREREALHATPTGWVETVPHHNNQSLYILENSHSTGRSDSSYVCVYVLDNKHSGKGSRSFSLSSARGPRETEEREKLMAKVLDRKERKWVSWISFHFSGPLVLFSKSGLVQQWWWWWGGGGGWPPWTQLLFDFLK